MSDDLAKGSPALLEGLLTSKPTWSNTSGYSAASAFFVSYVARAGDLMDRMDDEISEKETQMETHLQTQLGSRIRHLRVLCRTDGVVLYGSARTYHAKQLAQHLVKELTDLPILANEIEVC
jgi:hypothetical protein